MQPFEALISYVRRHCLSKKWIESIREQKPEQSTTTVYSNWIKRNTSTNTQTSHVCKQQLLTATTDVVVCLFI